MKKLFKAFLCLLTTMAMCVSIAVPAAAATSVNASSAMEFASGMGAGWNLGNAFDASDCTWLSNEMDYESAWNGAKTTKALISEIKKMGYKTIRIPVSWHNHIDANMNISKKWMARVKEVVDWCVAEDMYVIINIHHDISKNYFYPDSAHFESSDKYVKAIWKQIANTFKDYGNKVIFEGVNEPRAVGTNNEWWFNMNNISTTVQDYIKTLNKLNQSFVDTVRATGGNNKTRYLMISGYDTSCDGITNKYFEMPTDPAKDKLMTTVHIYSDKPKEYEALMDRAYKKYVQNGIPVVIGEFGTVAGTKNKADVEGKFVAAASARLMPCVRWDNNAFKSNDGKETYGLIDRNTVTWKFKDAAEAAVKNAVIKTSGTSNSNQNVSSSSSDKMTLKAKKASSTSIKLTWTEVKGADAYRVYLYNAKTNKYEKCLTLKGGTSYTIKNLSSGTYKYKIAPLYLENGAYKRGTVSDTAAVKL